MAYVKRHKSGQSVVEYMVVFAAIMFAMIVMQKYFLRGIMGKYKSAGDQVDYGRQYDPRRTVSCLYVKEIEDWLPEDCVRENGGTAFKCGKKCQAACSPGICSDRQ